MSFSQSFSSFMATPPPAYTIPLELGLTAQAIQLELTTPLGGDFVMVLGNCAFFDFEVPERISSGGKQQIVLHKYPGGARTGDTLGPDDEPIEWSGWFLDTLAEVRWNLIDTMRRQGLPVQLTWSTFNKLVLIEEATIIYRRYYQIEYRIKCVVLQDLGQPVAAAYPDLNTQVMSDLTDASTAAVAIVGLAAALATK